MDEVVILSSVRTPIGKYGKTLSGFKATELGEYHKDHHHQGQRKTNQHILIQRNTKKCCFMDDKKRRGCGKHRNPPTPSFPLELEKRVYPVFQINQ